MLANSDVTPIHPTQSFALFRLVSAKKIPVLAPDAGDVKPVIQDLADVGRPAYQRHAVPCSRKHTTDCGTDGACAHYCDVSDAL